MYSLTPPSNHWGKAKDGLGLEDQIGHDSARYILITESKSGSGARPRRAARSARIRAGQDANIREIMGSGFQSIRALTCGPATRVRAAAISATVTVSAGMVSAVRPPGLVGGGGGAQ